MPQTAFILILTDDEAQSQQLSEALRRKHAHACHIETTLEGALNSIRGKAPDVVVVAKNEEGAASVKRLAEALDLLAPHTTLIAVGEGIAGGASGKRVQVVALRASEDLAALADPIGQAASRAVTRRVDELTKQSLAQAPIEMFEGIVGASSSIKRIVERIRKAANNKLTVLIIGETGVGKELIARAVHNQSDRARKPFLHLNSAAISETLIESELFGHAKGSFTGATADRRGYFAAADGGTLFLDEIGDMPTHMQSKLLRVLEYREFTPVGSTETQRVDVRVIAATNVDLRKRIEERTFREDLYYRLHQWVIEAPPLRDRRGDIPILAQHLLRDANREHGVKVDGFSSEALGLLTKYYWPGNVRELKNVLVSVACEKGEGQIEADDLPPEIRGSRDIVPASAGLVGMSMDQIERMAIERALQATDGNREEAANMLKIGIRTLYRKLKEYGM